VGIFGSLDWGTAIIEPLAVVFVGGLLVVAGTAVSRWVNGEHTLRAKRESEYEMKLRNLVRLAYGTNADPVLQTPGVEGWITTIPRMESQVTETHDMVAELLRVQKTTPASVPGGIPFGIDPNG
jgi:hypothetical protein